MSDRRGAKDKYYEKVGCKLDVIKGWRRNGLRDYEIWENLGIGKDTFYRYKKLHSEFSDALKTGKDEADLTVENAAFKLATGYTVTIDGEEKYYPPNPTMIIFWLRNRKSKEWNNQIGQMQSRESSQTGGVIEIPAADAKDEN